MQAMDPNNQGIKIGVLSVGEVESFFSVMEMNKSGVKVLSHVGSLEIGAIDFDRVLVNLIEKMACQKCKQITLDELRTKKTQIKILKAANTVKKILTTNQKAPATLECVGDNQIDI
jgi:molecular chaperone DnaK (HSP70)